MTIPKWMTTEEIEAELKPAGSTSLDDIRQKMIEQSESPEAEARRHQEAIATSQFLQSSVIHSNRSPQKNDDPYLGELPNFRGGEIIRHERLEHEHKQ